MTSKEQTPKRKLDYLSEVDYIVWAEEASDGQYDGFPDYVYGVKLKPYEEKEKV